MTLISQDKGSIRRLIARHEEAIKALEMALGDNSTYVEVRMWAHDALELTHDAAALTFKFIRSF